MADWLTHTLIGWITGKTTRQDIALVAVGSLIPDLSKLDILLVILGVQDTSVFDPLHTPIGAILITLLIALFFLNIKKTALILLLGVSTHFILDFFLIHTHGGMLLLYPFSWDGWQLSVYTSDNYYVTILAVLISLLVYLIYRHLEKRRTSLKQS